MSGRRGAVAALLLLAVAAPLLANGGTVRVSREPAGVYTVSVFTSPTPLRTGELDVSVLVQDTAGQARTDVAVLVEARPVVGPEGEPLDADPVRHGATRQQATNKLFQAAKFTVETPGEWEVLVHVGAEEGGIVSFRAVLTEPTLLDRPLLLAALILLPLIVGGWLFSRTDGHATVEPRAERERLSP